MFSAWRESARADVLLLKQSNHFYAQTILMSWKFFATHGHHAGEFALAAGAPLSLYLLWRRDLVYFSCSHLCLCGLALNKHTPAEKMSYWVLFYFVVNGLSNSSELMRVGLAYTKILCEFNCVTKAVGKIHFIFMLWFFF